MRTLALLATAAFAAVAAAEPPHSKVDAPPTVVTVEIRGMEFQPQTLRVEQGQTIRWVNREAVPHTVVSGTVERTRRTTEKQPSGLFDSPNLAEGESFEFTPREKGRIPYFCGIHPFMTAEIIVE